MHDDIIVDDIFKNNDRPPRKQSGPKGRRGEKDLCKVLNIRFREILSNNPSWGQFVRTIGSGNRFGQVILSENAKKIFAGDIASPDSFKFTFESKHGYPEIDLCSALDGGHKKLDDFLCQAVKDSERIGRKPLLCWKKDYQSWVIFIRKQDFDIDNFDYYMVYREWYVLSLANLMSLSDSFFFD